MDEKIRLLANGLGEHRIKAQENLSYHTNPPLRAIAKYFYIATSQKELTDCLSAVFDLKIPFVILGSGTKTLANNINVATLVIKNRSTNLKVGAIKGKVGRAGIGVEEAMVEVDSGTTLTRLNQFLLEQKLQPINKLMFPGGTVGGSVFSEESLRDRIEHVTVWDQGEVFQLKLSDLQSEQVVLSAVLRIKA